MPYLVEQQSPLADVTVRELLSHAGGVYRDSRDGDFWQLRRPFPDRGQLRDLLVTPESAVVPRSERFKYSNIGYALLGLVIEAASGNDYADQLRHAVVEPLGLRHTGAELDPARLDDYATGYSALAYADTRVPIEHVDTRAMAPATGFYSTASDLVAYFSAHFHGDERLLTDVSKHQMQQSLWEVGAPDKHYGLGMGLHEIGARAVVGHNGGYPGHITSSVADPVARLAVSVLTNAVDGPADAVHARGGATDRSGLRRPRPARGGCRRRERADPLHRTLRRALGCVRRGAAGRAAVPAHPGGGRPGRGRGRARRRRRHHAAGRGRQGLRLVRGAGQLRVRRRRQRGLGARAERRHADPDRALLARRASRARNGSLMLDQAVYRITDPHVVRALVTKHSWVTLVSDLPDGLVVSHLAGLRTAADGSGRAASYRVQAKAKLSQDKSAADRTGVVAGLETDPVHANPALAARMRADGVLP